MVNESSIVWSPYKDSLAAPEKNFLNQSLEFLKIFETMAGRLKIFRYRDFSGGNFLTS